MFGNSKIGAPFKGYYITAYGIAVKHGFVGSEEEWLESLNGGNAEFRYNSETKMIEYRHSKTEVWTEMMTLAEFQEGVIKDTLEEMRSARDTAVAAKGVAEALAESTRSNKEAVFEMREEVSASEANTKVYSESAVAAAETAVSAASLAADVAAETNADKNAAENARESALAAKEEAVFSAQIAGNNREAVSEMLTRVQGYAESVSSDRSLVSSMRDDTAEYAQEAKIYADTVKEAACAEITYKTTDVDLTTCTTVEEDLWGETTGVIGKNSLTADSWGKFTINVSGRVCIKASTDSNESVMIINSEICRFGAEGLYYEGEIVSPITISTTTDLNQGEHTVTFEEFVIASDEAIGSTAGMMPDGSLKMLYELNEKTGDIDTALDSILAIQESLMGGDTV